MLDKPVPIGIFSRGLLVVCWRVGWGSFGSIFVVGMLFDKFLLESLILAQDERWRRA